MKRAQRPCSRRNIATKKLFQLHLAVALSKMRVTQEPGDSDTRQIGALLSVSGYFPRADSHTTYAACSLPSGVDKHKQRGDAVVSRQVCGYTACGVPLFITARRVFASAKVRRLLVCVTRVTSTDILLSQLVKWYLFLGGARTVRCCTVP